MPERRAEKPAGPRASLLANVLDLRCPGCGVRTASTLFWRCPGCGYPSRTRAKCPGCGKVTQRTRDMACQWCGYTLNAELFKHTLASVAQAVTAADDHPQPVQPHQPEPPASVAIAPPAPDPPAAVVDPPAPVAQTNIPTPPIESVAPQPPPEIAPPAPQPTAEADVPPVVVREVSTQKRPPTAPLDDVIVASVDDVTADFQTDATLAEVKYHGKTVKIKGVVVLTVDTSDGVPPAVVLGRVDEQPGTVRCTFEPRYATLVGRLSAGQRVAVVGRFEGIGEEVRLVDCLPVG